MKKKLGIFASMCMIFASVFCITGCDKGDKIVVPTYQGMTISSTLQSSTLSANALSHPDHHIGHDEHLEKDIEDVVDIDVNVDEEVKYYVEPDSTFIISVHINNPNQYEIQSFTLNGKKYANYMFEQGSTMETLLLKVTAPSQSGYAEYTIDAIKYIDGTEIKDVDMSKGNKSVKAGISYTQSPSATVSNLNIQSTYFVMDVSISDPCNIIKNTPVTIYLSDGKNVVGSKQLYVGQNNNVRFENLNNYTTYEYGIVTTIDMIDGRDLRPMWLKTDTVTTLSLFAFKNISATTTSISFDVDKTGSEGDITQISLYDTLSDQLKSTVSYNDQIVVFDNLLSNHSYTIYVDYNYSQNNATVSDWIKTTQTTQAKQTPTVSIATLNSDKTSIEYTLSMTDIDNTCTILNVQLLKDGSIVDTNTSISTGSFSDLLSNNEYTVKVNYLYNLNDGQGNIDASTEQSISTEAKQAPTVSIVDEKLTTNSISATIQTEDIDNILNITSVDLYKDGDIISSKNAISFEGLSSYTEYLVKINYSYDLNDGEGVHNTSVTKEITTHPIIEFTNCDIINTSAVLEGETIYIQANLNNANGAIPTSVVVNGQSYNCASSTNTNKIYIEIVNEGQFEGGQTTLTIEQLNMTLGGVEYSVRPTQNNSDSIFINGVLKVVSVQLVDSDSKVIEYCDKDADLKLLITLSNKTGYSIDSCDLKNNTDSKVSSFTPIKIDDNHYSVTIPKGNMGWESYTLYSLKYSNDYGVDKTLNLGAPKYQANLVYRLSSLDVVEIDSVEKLMNIDYDNSYKIYKLTADLDLSDYEWTNLGDFYGVFDGNGHKISNMRHVATYSDVGIYIGLFKGASGLFKDLTIDNVTILLTLNESANNCNKYIHFGAIAADVIYSSNIICKNCNVQADVKITHNNVAEIDNCDYYYYIGGIIGDAGGKSNIFDNCSANVNFDIKNNDKLYKEYTGGISGGSRSTDIFIVTNCTITGNIKSWRAGVVAAQINGNNYFKNNTCDIYLTVGYYYYPNPHITKLEDIDTLGQ